jgi:glycosyltransferase involved in cell wall biosynthesis
MKYNRIFNEVPQSTSIIVTHWGMDELRSKMLKTSLESLIETTKHLPVEIIVIDNGSNENDSVYLQNLVDMSKINCLIINSENMGLGMARNQGIALASGNYVCIADNDIYYKYGWLEACWRALEAYPRQNIYATCIDYPGTSRKKYWKGKLNIYGEEYLLSTRAGSNCFVIRDKDLKFIGEFSNHRITGCLWTDRATELGFLAAVAPGELVYDLGLRQGFNFKITNPIKRTLTNGEVLYFNEDNYEPNRN